MKKEFEFTAKEIELLEATTGILIAGNINRIKREVNEYFNRMKSNGVDPEKRLAEIATQEKYNRKTMSNGDNRFYGQPNDRYDGYNTFGGECEEFSFQRLMTVFRFCNTDSRPRINSSWLLPCFTISRAMQKDHQVDLFVRSIISAFEKVHRDLSLWESFIYEIMCAYCGKETKQGRMTESLFDLNKCNCCGKRIEFTKKGIFGVVKPHNKHDGQICPRSGLVTYRKIDV